MRHSTEFVAGSEGVEASDLDELMATLTASPSVHQFAVETLEARAREARLAEEQREAERRAREAERLAREEQERRARAEEAAAWGAANMTACSAPATVDTCDRVHKYLDKYPKGKHAVEAQGLLDRADEPIRSLRDDLAWNSTDQTGCEKPKTEDACEPVRAYLNSYPNGNHAARGCELIANVEPVFEKMRAAREAREAAAAARERAAMAGDSGEGWSGGSYSGGRSTGGGSVYVRGYTRKDGTYVRPHTRSRPGRCWSSGALVARLPRTRTVRPYSQRQWRRSSPRWDRSSTRRWTRTGQGGAARIRGPIVKQTRKWGHEIAPAHCPEHEAMQVADAG